MGLFSGITKSLNDSTASVPEERLQIVFVKEGVFVGWGGGINAGTHNNGNIICKVKPFINSNGKVARIGTQEETYLLPTPYHHVHKSIDHRAYGMKGIPLTGIDFVYHPDNTIINEIFHMSESNKFKQVCDERDDYYRLSQNLKERNRILTTDLGTAMKEVAYLNGELKAGQSGSKTVQTPISSTNMGQYMDEQSNEQE